MTKYYVLAILSAIILFFVIYNDKGDSHLKDTAVIRTTTPPTCLPGMERNTYPKTPSVFPIPEGWEVKTVLYGDRTVVSNGSVSYHCLHPNPSFEYSNECLRDAWRRFGWWIKDTALCPEDEAEIKDWSVALFEDYLNGGLPPTGNRPPFPRQPPDPGPFDPSELH